MFQPYRYRTNKDQAMAEFSRHHSLQLYEKATMAEEDILSHMARAEDVLEDALAEADQEKVNHHQSCCSM